MQCKKKNKRNKKNNINIKNKVKIKSSGVIKIIFEYIGIKATLNIIKTSKKFQEKFNINILDYQKYFTFNYKKLFSNINNTNNISLNLNKYINILNSIPNITFENKKNIINKFIDDTKNYFSLTFKYNENIYHIKNNQINSNIFFEKNLNISILKNLDIDSITINNILPEKDYLSFILNKKDSINSLFLNEKYFLLYNNLNENNIFKNLLILKIILKSNDEYKQLSYLNKLNTIEELAIINPTYINNNNELDIIDISSLKSIKFLILLNCKIILNSNVISFLEKINIKQSLIKTKNLEKISFMYLKELMYDYKSIKDTYKNIDFYYLFRLKILNSEIYTKEDINLINKLLIKNTLEKVILNFQVNILNKNLLLEIFNHLKNNKNLKELHCFSNLFKVSSPIIYLSNSIYKELNKFSIWCYNNENDLSILNQFIDDNTNIKTLSIKIIKNNDYFIKNDSFKIYENNLSNIENIYLNFQNDKNNAFKFPIILYIPVKSYSNLKIINFTNISIKKNIVNIFNDALYDYKYKLEELTINNNYKIKSNKDSIILLFKNIQFCRFIEKISITDNLLKKNLIEKFFSSVHKLLYLETLELKESQKNKNYISINKYNYLALSKNFNKLNNINLIDYNY